MADFMLSTVDNPFSPFTEFMAWYQFDVAHGYQSLQLLGRVSSSSSELSDADQDFAYDSAVDEIVRENVSGMHRKVQASDFVAKN